MVIVYPKNAVEKIHPVMTGTALTTFQLAANQYPPAYIRHSPCVPASPELPVRAKPYRVTSLPCTRRYMHSVDEITRLADPMRYGQPALANT